MMSIHLRQILNHPLAVKLAVLLARVIPPQLGYPICDALGSWIAKHHSSTLTRAVQINQWIASGAALSEKQLDRAVQATLKNNARDLYTLYRNLHNHRFLESKIILGRAEHGLLSRAEFDTRGLIVAGLHISIFDLVLRSLIQNGFKALVLTLPDPQGARRVEYEMRKDAGMYIQPASIASLREAVNYLRRGGTVVTGIDRPLENSKHCPRFFGHAAALPTHHISLALNAHVPIVVMAVVQQDDGNYRLLSSEPIEMSRDEDHRNEIIRNAELVLKQAEAFIRLEPQQWNVPLPVWPDLLDIVPR